MPRQQQVVVSGGSLKALVKGVQGLVKSARKSKVLSRTANQLGYAPAGAALGALGFGLRPTGGSQRRYRKH